MQPGDVVATAADTDALERWIGFKPLHRSFLVWKSLQSGIYNSADNSNFCPLLMTFGLHLN